MITSGDYLTGITQPVTVEADQPYQFTLWAQQSSYACTSFHAACSVGSDGYFDIAATNGGLAVNNWVQLSIICTWNAERVSEASVSALLPSCSGGKQVHFDDALLVKV